MKKRQVLCISLLLALTLIFVGFGLGERSGAQNKNRGDWFHRFPDR